MDIAGATVMVTGASGGLGAVVARDLAARGASVVVTARRIDRIEALAAELGGTAVPADLRRREDVAALAERMAGIDVLVAAAAVGRGPALAALEVDDVDEILEVNLRAPVVLATRFLREHLDAGRPGHVVLVGALAGKAPTPESHVYCTTKAGVRAFALAAAQDLVGTDVGVSVVEPGFVRDVGMFHDGGTVLPPGVRTSSPAQVAAGVRRALLTGRTEIVVAPAEMRALAGVAAVAPAAVARLLRRARGPGQNGASTRGPITP